MSCLVLVISMLLVMTVTGAVAGKQCVQMRLRTASRVQKYTFAIHVAKDIPIIRQCLYISGEATVGSGMGVDNARAGRLK